MIQMILGIVAGILLERVFNICNRVKPMAVALIAKLMPKVKAIILVLVAKIKAWIAAKMEKKTIAK